MTTRLRELARVPWIAATAVATAARLPSLGEPLALDVSVYATAGFKWLEGDVPYRDMFDNKGPLVPELYAVLDLLLPTSAAALRLALLALFAVSAWQLSSLVARHAGSPAAWTATVAYAIAASSYAFEGPDPNTEQLGLPLMVAAVDLADRARAAQRPLAAAGAGAALGLLACFKPTYALLAVPVLLVLGRDLRRVAAAAAGAIGAVALALLPLLLAGSVGDMVDAVRSNGEYASDGFAAVADRGTRAVVEYWTTFPGDALLGAAAVSAVLAWRAADLRRPLLVALAWTLAAFVVARAGGHSFAHYFVPLIPPLAILIGLGVAAVPAAARTPVAAVTLGVLAAALLVTPMRAELALQPGERFGATHVPALARVSDAADAVERLTRPGDRVFVVTGGPSNAGQAIYWLARRRPATRFIFADSILPPPWEKVAQDLERTPPTAVVVMPGAPTAPVGAALDGYREVEAIRGPAGPTRVLLAP